MEEVTTTRFYFAFWQLKKELNLFSPSRKHAIRVLTIDDDDELFCATLGLQKTVSLISTCVHCLGFSPSQIYNILLVSFAPMQNLSSNSSYNLYTAGARDVVWARSKNSKS